MSVSAVVDTNIIVSALISSRGFPDAIIRELHQRRFRLVVTREVLAEYQRIVSRPSLARRFSLSTSDVAAFMRALLLRAELVEPSPIVPVTVRDMNDMHLLSAALGGTADFLVSGDMDLLDLADDPRLPNLQIVTPRVFLLKVRG